VVLLCYFLFPHPLPSSRIPRRRAHHLPFAWRIFSYIIASARDAPAAPPPASPRLRARMTGSRSPMTLCVRYGEVDLCLSVNVIVRFNDISLKCPLPKIKGHRRKANYQSQLTFVTDPFFSCSEHFDTFIPTFLPSLLLYLTRWWSQIAAVQPVHLQRSGVAAATGSMVSACCMLNPRWPGTFIASPHATAKPSQSIVRLPRRS
jgi:hypothetical protein